MKKILYDYGSKKGAIEDYIRGCDLLHNGVYFNEKTQRYVGRYGIEYNHAVEYRLIYRILRFLFSWYFKN